MYVLPRALESAWSTARKRAYVPIVPFGETILGAVAMGMVMDAYKVGTGTLSMLSDLLTGLISTLPDLSRALCANCSSSWLGRCSRTVQHDRFVLLGRCVPSLMRSVPQFYTVSVARDKLIRSRRVQMSVEQRCMCITSHFT